MTGDAIERPPESRLMAVALLKPGWEEEYHGSPEIFQVFGVGRMEAFQRMPDGRFNILLKGVVRARAVEWLQMEPYRRARLEELCDEPDENAETGPAAERLAAALWRLAELFPEYKTNIERMLKIASKSPQAFSFQASSLPCVELKDRQRILEMNRCGWRIDEVRRCIAGAISLGQAIGEMKKRNPPEKPSLN